MTESPAKSSKYCPLLECSPAEGYFQTQWKVVQIILTLKPGIPPHELASYRPKSLLPIVSKIFEKLHLTRLLPVIENNTLISSHQFGFRQRHSTKEQTHQIVHQINEALENKQYCSSAFHKVWHTRLLYKLRLSLPLNYFAKILPAKHIYSLRLETSTLNSSPFMQAYPKAVSLYHYYIYYSPPTSQLHQQLSQMILQFWP
jgi:hypothetical protein